jgi:hypothetical protein
MCSRCGGRGGAASSCWAWSGLVSDFCVAVSRGQKDALFWRTVRIGLDCRGVFWKSPICELRVHMLGFGMAWPWGLGVLLGCRPFLDLLLVYPPCCALGCGPAALAFPCFASGLLALPLCGAALTFFAAAKKVSKESGLQPLALKRVPRLEGVVVHLESVFSRNPLS